jgi:hypothetical protein
VEELRERVGARVAVTMDAGLGAFARRGSALRRAPALSPAAGYMPLVERVPSAGGGQPVAKPASPPSPGKKALTMSSMKAYAFRSTTQALLSSDDHVPVDEWEAYAGKVGVVFPLDPRKLAWDMVMLNFVLFVCVVMPFQMGMGVQAEGVWSALESVTVVAFIADLLLNFRVAYLDGDVYVIDTRQIAQRYVTGGWFVIDFLSSFPYDALDWLFDPDGNGGVGGAESFRMLRTLRILRLLRLFKALRIEEVLSRLEERTGVDMHLLSLLKIVGVILYLTHLQGCVWFYLHRHVRETGADDDPITWLTEYERRTGEAVLDAAVWSRYMLAVYWALATLTTGAPPPPPHRSRRRRTAAAAPQSPPRRPAAPPRAPQPADRSICARPRSWVRRRHRGQ